LAENGGVHDRRDVTPAESDFLLRLSGLALSFVGFSAIVVTLRGALGGKLSDRHVRLVRLYIESGLIVTGLGLVPALLALLDVSATVVWRTCSAAAALIFTLLMVTQFRRRRTVEGHFPLWVVVIFAISIIVVLGLWLNAAGVPFRPGAGPYAVALTWTLGVCGFIFLRTIEIFLHRDPPA
jgi:hypothetical protein